MERKDFLKVSESPTNPHAIPARQSFDVADLYQGPLRLEPSPPGSMALDEKLRKAYFWIVNHAIISPYYDIEYNDGPHPVFSMGDARSQVHLPSAQSYSSFVLLPLLNFAVRRKCLLVGGPGRGKTSSAVLMGVLAGYPLQEVRRAIQHGQPQMTITDLLGNPMPSYLIGAKTMDEIKISWRKWLGMRVKIIDEYNRIPTRTQSALLTLMGDNYAEIFDQIYECPESAWYLTANDDAGGGTYQVIEALRDRIDIVVKTLHFNSRFLQELITRIEDNVHPEEVVPEQIIFTEQEMDHMYQAIMQIRIPPPVRRLIEFFASHFEFSESAGLQLEYKTKDTIKLAGLDFHNLAIQESGKDKILDLGLQTQNGLSVRALITTLIFCKAMAFFRGNSEVAPEDVRQILPFVLHDKLIQNSQAPFFDELGHGVFKIDKISWLRHLFELSCDAYQRLNLEHDDPVADLSAEFAQGLTGVAEEEVRQRLHHIEGLLRELGQTSKLHGYLFDDILKLKYFHQRYTNYLTWLQWKS